MPWALEVEEPGSASRILPLTPGRSLLGRSPDNAIVIAHASLSRQHARLEVGPNEVWVEDLGSKNGTLVDGLPVRARQPVYEGDRLRFGEVDAHLRQVKERVVSQEIQAMSRLMYRPETKPAEQNDLRLRMLLRSAQLLSAPGELPDVLSRVLSLLASLVPVDRASILLKNDDGTLSLVCAWGAPPDDGDKPYSERIVQTVQQKGKAVLYDDVQAAGTLAGSMSVVAQKIRSSMAAPLATNTSQLGVICVDNQAYTHAFTEADLELLSGFANHAAMAIENAQLARRLSDEAVMRSTFQRFFPPATVRRLMHRKGAEFEPERVKVTTIFSDITGFTQLSSEMAPERVVRLLNHYFPVMAAIVFEREGTLEKYIGDALMAVWGAPFAHPDDSERAVGAAVAMQRALHELRPALAEEGLPPIEVHIGIHTGPASFANIGSAEYLQFATVGISTSAAARICNVAAANEIVISDAVRRELHTNYRLTRLPSTPMKGVAESMDLWRLDWA